MSEGAGNSRASMAGHRRPSRRPTSSHRRSVIRLQLGDLERRVHGAGLLCPGSFTGPSGHQLLPHGSDEASIAAAALAASEQNEIFRLSLDEVERSIVVPVCRNRGAREFFPDHTRRLDNYLAAAKRLMKLLKDSSQVVSGELHDRAKCLLHAAMSSLAREFCYVRIWRSDAFPGILIRESVRPSCSGGSASSASWSSSSDSFTSASGSNDSCRPAQPFGEDRSVRSNNAFSDASYIDIKSMSILGEIAGVMIQGGYEDLIRGAIGQHSDQLARNVKILDIGNIVSSNMDESKEKIVQIWTSAVRVIIGVLAEMQRHLNGQDFGHFNTFREDYFMAIAKVSVMKLLHSASSLCIHVGTSNNSSCEDSYARIKHSPSMIINEVMMFQALKDAMPEILALFVGQTNEFVLLQAQRLTHGFSAMLIRLFVELHDSVRSQQLVITDTGVHHVTRHIMHHLGFLVQQKNTVYNLMPDGNPHDFGQLLKQLISALDFMLDTNSQSLRFPGQSQVFLLNNVHFMVEQAKNTDVGLVLGEIWLWQHHCSLEQYMSSYVEASWAPVMSPFERRTRVPIILWPHQLLDKFTSSFEMTCSVQKAWKVADPVVRQKLREAICQKVIPLYRMHTENYCDKKHKSAKYSIEQVELQLLEMFEG